MNKQFIIVLQVLSQVLGNVWLSRGMHQVGEITTLDLNVLASIAWRILTNPWIVLGVVFLAASLLIFLVALSQLDLSYVLPMTAFGHILNAAFAFLILQEHISMTRWLGTFVIAIGVYVIGMSEFRQSQRGIKS
jgi:transporter family protein